MIGPRGDAPAVEDEKLGASVDEGKEEREDDIDREEEIHDVVRYVQLPVRVRI